MKWPLISMITQSRLKIAINVNSRGRPPPSLVDLASFLNLINLFNLIKYDDSVPRGWKENH